MGTKKNLIMMAIGLILIVSRFNICASTTSLTDFKSNIIYVLDGEKMLEEREIIIQDEKIYIPIEHLEEVLNIKIQLDENIINVKDGTKIKENKNKNEDVFLESAIVVDVDLPGKMIEILPYSHSKEKEAYITLDINDETKIFYEAIDKNVPLAMLEKNMLISIKYDATQTNEGEKEYRGKEIIIKQDNEIKAQECYIIRGLEIIEINTLKGYIKVAYTNKDKYKEENQIIIHIDQNTNIKNKLNQSLDIKDLSIGQKIEVLTNGILTASIPPQTLGLEIIIN